MIQTLEWTDQGVRFIDQTKLPMEETYVTCKTHEQVAEVMGKTRPTAVNLFWAIRRMQEKLERIRIRPLAQIKQTLIEEAQRMHAEDIAANQAMGRHGAPLMPASG